MAAAENSENESGTKNPYLGKGRKKKILKRPTVPTDRPPTGSPHRGSKKEARIGERGEEGEVMISPPVPSSSSTSSSLFSPSLGGRRFLLLSKFDCRQTEVEEEVVVQLRDLFLELLRGRRRILDIQGRH